MADWNLFGPQQAHHVKEPFKIITLPGGTKVRVSDYTGADKMIDEDPNNFEVYSFVEGDEQEWQKFVQDNHYKQPVTTPENSVVTESDRYWEAHKRMKQGGPSPQGGDWRLDVIKRKLQPMS